jgi:methylated-DNA-[protein]-cysteine S-methyltransferase
MMELFMDEMKSPIGTIQIAYTEKALCALEFDDHKDRMRELLKRRFGQVKFTERENTDLRARLASYFAGDCSALQGIEVDGGGSEFQSRVWEALREIPPGKTASYGEIAVRVGSPSAARAVGLANSLNPIAIVVPCHRVIGASGKLTGYAGGLDRKRWLLEHERGGVLTSAR